MREVREYVAVGDTVSVVLPHSEVCMHMRVAGKRMLVRLEAPRYFNGELIPGASPMAQLVTDTGRDFSIPVLYGEAGFYRDESGRFYTSRIAEPDTRHLRLVRGAA